MRVFVTGATGFISSAVVPELIGAGHGGVGLARSADGVIRLAAIHSGTDLRAIAAAGRLVTEEDGPAPGTHGTASEKAAVAPAGRGVRSSPVRLAPSVHGRGDRGYVPRLIALARGKGVSAHVGDGANRWPGVHRSDAAGLLRPALEEAPAGSRLHGADEEAWRTGTSPR